MNGKIRVSIVATSLKGSNIYPDPKPILNVVNGSSDRNNNFNDNLFSKNNIEKNVINSIDGATALKLDENYEIKNSEEQNALIDSFENKEEKMIAKDFANKTYQDEIPSGVSIESASYMENQSETEIGHEQVINNNQNIENKDEEYTPKLFSDDQNKAEHEEIKEDINSENLFDQDTNEEEDFEIPAFLRRQKF